MNKIAIEMKHLNSSIGSLLIQCSSDGQSTSSKSTVMLTPPVGLYLITAVLLAEC